MTDDTDHLETKDVFIDTEAYVRERFNWEAKTFTRIAELAKKRQIHVLTTSITKREVRNKINEALTHAQSALQKHEVVFEQLSIATDNAKDGASERLLKSFDDFLKRVNATEVPLTQNLETLFDDYFERVPPFSEGKKSEFPDAAVVHALKQFAAQTKKSIYVVSGDRDLMSCCADGSNLIHASSLSEIISRATVTKKLHDDLLEFAVNDFTLRDDIRTQLRTANVFFYGLARFADRIEVEATVNGVENFNVVGLNVISREVDQTLVCEIECEACVGFSFKIQVGGRFEEDDSESVWVFPSAEVTIDFNPDGISRFTYISGGLTSSLDVDAAEVYCLERFR
ncbi:hypothetical protein UP10_12785 [Bradyrhizobium sp. LTSPM299]|uniref:PIN domain-containing protein n=1 Tax=Bradyrhizobium sp. LTSPM299 TaxID=1619233 RepID=UPI0005C91022|nr:PIN domain-containing protein [Bradyrhizobium sp. LTSPM299]KJC60483.1 hypothetical protein UP10_12785 [Bradyrhizobium sp. LTSPM299]